MNPWICRHCGLKFKDYGERAAHEDAEHPPRNPFKPEKVTLSIKDHLRLSELRTTQKVWNSGWYKDQNTPDFDSWLKKEIKILLDKGAT